MEATLPIEFTEFSTRVNHIRKVNGREWSSTCPACADLGHNYRDRSVPDRCRWFLEGKIGPHGWCRKCGHVFKPGKEAGRALSEAEQADIRQRAEARRAEEEARRSRALARMQGERPCWKVWHDGMDADGWAYWQGAGVLAEHIRQFRLGQVRDADAYPLAPAYTIPFPARGGQDVLTVQYRLAHPPPDGDKYRFEAGLGAPAFLAQPERLPGHNPLLLVEGVKKALVALPRLPLRHLDIQALASKTPSRELVDQIAAEYERVYLLLDPDAYAPTISGKRGRVSTAQALASRFKDARLVRLPGKLDDLLLLSGVSPADIASAIRRAEKIGATKCATMYSEV